MKSFIPHSLGGLKRTQLSVTRGGAMGQIVHEKWNRNAHQGEYGIIVANRFCVAVSGNGGDINDLKSAMASANLAGLAALQNAGVQSYLRK